MSSIAERSSDWLEVTYPITVKVRCQIQVSDSKTSSFPPFSVASNGDALQRIRINLFTPQNPSSELNSKA